VALEELVKVLAGGVEVEVLDEQDWDETTTTTTRGERGKR
jgi:hypothetical protein